MEKNNNLDESKDIKKIFGKKKRHFINWYKMYIFAYKYFEFYGDLNIPRNFKTYNGSKYDENGFNLGEWIVNQRRAYRNRSLKKEDIKNFLSPLTDEQVFLLEDIGMSWNLFDSKWHKMYGLAEKFFEYNGHLKVPFEFKTLNGYEYNENGFNLGSWIHRQRSVYRNFSKENSGTDASLTHEQVLMLESIGMVWNIKKNQSDIQELCNEYGIDMIKNMNIIKHISCTELKVKILFLNDNNIPLTNNGVLHEIFSMSSINMKNIYGVNLEELVNTYVKEKSL